MVKVYRYVDSQNGANLCLKCTKIHLGTGFARTCLDPLAALGERISCPDTLPAMRAYL